MGTRFGRRAADGTYEYHDSRESLDEAERAERAVLDEESNAGFAFLFGVIGLLVGGVLTRAALLKYGIDWPKEVRFGLVIAGAGVLAYLLAKFGKILLKAALGI